MSRMRAVQVSGANGAFRTGHARYPDTGTPPSPDQSAGVRHLPQRFVHQNGRLSRNSISARSRARSGWAFGCGRLRCTRLEGGRAGRRRLAWRPLRALHLVPPRRFHHLHDGANSRNLLRRRVCGLHDRAVRSAGGRSGRIIFGGSRAAAVCGDYDVQRVAPQRRRARAISSRCSASAAWVISACNSRPRWAVIPWPSPEARTRSRWRASWARSTTSTARRRTSPSELTKLGGARVILATVTDAKSMSAAVGGLGIDGKLIVLGASMQPIEVSPLALISARRSISGWPSGTASDSEDTMDFSVLSGIRPLIETSPWSGRRRPTSG